MKNKRFKSSSALMAVGALLTMLALLLTANNLREEHKAQKAASEMLSEMEFGTPLRSEDIGETVIPDYVLNPDMSMPSEEIDGFEYIGKLEIPALNISLPVMKEWNYKLLKNAPCCYTGSIYKNNMVIAGHNYKGHFGGLKNLAEGDDITFTDIDGNVFSYTVSETVILAADKTCEMTNRECPLTLFTCTTGGASRVTVRCELKRNINEKIE